MKRIFVLILACSSLFSLSAQFEIIAKTTGNSCQWFIKNTGTDTVKLTSASMRFFHQTPYIDFTPSISNPGGGKYQYTGNFSGGGQFTFRYKTVQMPALDSTLKPGDSELMSTTTNTGPAPDTIINSGVKIYYSVKGVSKNTDAFPTGSAPCPSEAVFISAGTTNAGIKLGSAAAQNLHFGVCEPQLVAIVFDANTLQRKAVANQVPHCPYGRMWTTFGNSSDYQVYYTFNISNDTGRRQFDTFINAVSTGDYVAIVNTLLEPLDYFNLIHSSLQKIGFDDSSFSTTIGYLTLLGKKGAAASEAAYNFCQDQHGVCYISLEQSMVQGDFSSHIQDYSVCYENQYQILDKTAQNQTRQPVQSAVNIYPNPTDEGWHLEGISAETSLELLTISGNKVNLPLVTIENYLAAKDLPSGTYLLILSNQNKFTIERKLLIKN